MTEKTQPDEKILKIMTEILTSVGENIGKNTKNLPTESLFFNTGGGSTATTATNTTKTDEPLPEYVDDDNEYGYVSAFESLDRAFQLLKELEDWATDHGEVEFLLKIADRYVQLGSVLIQ